MDWWERVRGEIGIEWCNTCIGVISLTEREFGLEPLLLRMQRQNRILDNQNGYHYLVGYMNEQEILADLGPAEGHAALLHLVTASNEKM